MADAGEQSQSRTRSDRSGPGVSRQGQPGIGDASLGQGGYGTGAAAAVPDASSSALGPRAGPRRDLRRAGDALRGRRCLGLRAVPGAAEDGAATGGIGRRRARIRRHRRTSLAWMIASTSLSEDYKQLQSRLESIPKPAPAPDLAPLEMKVAQVDRLSRQVEEVGKKLDPLSEQLAKTEHRITELDSKLVEVRHEVSAAGDHTAVARGRDASLSRTSGPSASRDDRGRRRGPFCRIR